MNLLRSCFFPKPVIGWTVTKNVYPYLSSHAVMSRQQVSKLDDLMHHLELLPRQTLSRPAPSTPK